MSETPSESRLELLKQVASIPTAAGREDRVIAFVRSWVEARPELAISEDRAGNLTIEFRNRGRSGVKRAAPLYITAHMDHPAFVVERVVSPGTLELSFRGGVMDVFFAEAPIVLHGRGGGPVAARVAEELPTQSAAGKHYLAEVSDGADQRAAEGIGPGDIGVWALPEATIDEHGVLHAPACDDLAALAAALAAMDELRARRGAGQAPTDVRLLLTRAEEIGFIGAIAACKLQTMARGARVVALENSRAFADSPVGGGPIVRVGDRMSIFTPWLTAACAARAEEVFGGPSVPVASRPSAGVNKRPWQRKLMAGGACEASVFCLNGYDATCICLPLGNYHNMANLAELQAGTYDAVASGPARCAPEFIHTGDYLGMVDLLAALGSKPPEPGDSGFAARLDKLYTEKAFVLGGAPAAVRSRRVDRKAGKQAGPGRKKPASKRRAADPAVRGGKGRIAARAPKAKRTGRR